MRSYKIKPAPGDFHLDAQHSPPLRFTPILKLPVVDYANRKARQNGDAVLAALIIQVMGKCIIHLCELCELGDFIHALRAAHAAVYFLQPNQIRMLMIDHFGDSFQIHLLIHSDANMNVIGHDTQHYALSRMSEQGLAQTKRHKNDYDENERYPSDHFFCWSKPGEAL